MTDNARLIGKQQQMLAMVLQDCEPALRKPKQLPGLAEPAAQPGRDAHADTRCDGYESMPGI